MNRILQAAAWMGFAGTSFALVRVAGAFLSAPAVERWSGGLAIVFLVAGGVTLLVGLRLGEKPAGPGLVNVGIAWTLAAVATVVAFVWAPSFSPTTFDWPIAIGILVGPFLLHWGIRAKKGQEMPGWYGIFSGL